MDLHSWAMARSKIPGTQRKSLSILEQDITSLSQLGAGNAALCPAKDFSHSEFGLRSFPFWEAVPCPADHGLVKSMESAIVCASACFIHWSALLVGQHEASYLVIRQR